MYNFIFHNPTKLIFGKDTIKELSKEIPKEKHTLLLYGKGSIKTNGVYEQIKNALAGYKITEFPGISPNPKYELLMEAVKLIKQEKIDFLLAVGGGSVLDGTKFIAAAVNYRGNDPWEIVAHQAPISEALPIGTVLTLPATGSEMNCGAVISKASTPDKLGFGHPLLYPKFSILDPTTTFSLPHEQTANGITDAFIHVTEQYLTYPCNTPLQDRMAEGILLTLLESAPKVFANPHDYAIRANLMLASTLALNDWLSAGTAGDWTTHSLGHELTAKFGLDHAKTLAIILPNLLEYKRQQKHAKLLQYAQRVWQINVGSDDAKITQAITKTREFFESLGIKTRLSQYGIDKTAIPEIVKQLERHACAKLGENGDITLEDSANILLMSL
jgi:NADP-dependent alcohol dehydrogenase